MTFSDLLKKLHSGDLSHSILVDTIRPYYGSDEKHVHYLQSQNGNLYSEDFFSNGEDGSEFEALRADVPPEVDFVRDALGSSEIHDNVLQMS